MAAPRGNQLWKRRAKHGRNREYETTEDLYKACCEYFEWAEKNTLIEKKAFAYLGKVTYARLPQMRAMTITGLCLHLGIARCTWYEYVKSEHPLSEVAQYVEDVIYEQKFTGAAAGLLNPSIIARELGLKESVDHTSTDGSMTPKPTRIELVAPDVNGKD